MLSITEETGGERAKQMIERYAKASGEVRVAVKLCLADDEDAVLIVVLAQGEVQTTHLFLLSEFPALLKTLEILDTSLWPGQFYGLREVLRQGWDAAQERIRRSERKVLV